MFKAELSEKFEQIFKVKKVSYDLPGESREQECLFVNIETCRTSVKDGRVKSMITGSAYMVAQNDKLPFGFYMKAIKQADLTLTKDLFFYDIESNTQRFRNIAQLGFSFTYFFDSQYDPAIGSITSVDLDIQDEE